MKNGVGWLGTAMIFFTIWMISTPAHGQGTYTVTYYPNHAEDESPFTISPGGVPPSDRSDCAGSLDGKNWYRAEVIPSGQYVGVMEFAVLQGSCADADLPVQGGCTTDRPVQRYFITIGSPSPGEPVPVPVQAVRVEVIEEGGDPVIEIVVQMESQDCEGCWNPDPDCPCQPIPLQTQR